MAEVPTYPIAYHYGDSFELAVQWLGADGNPKDLTGYLSTFQVRKKDGTLVLGMDSDTVGGISVTGLTGTTTINATPARMTGGTLEQGVTYEYDWEVKSGDGTIVRTLIKGAFRCDKQVAVGV